MKTYEIRKSVSGDGADLAVLAFDPSGARRTVEIVTPAEAEDLFWVLARYLSRTVDDDAEAAPCPG